MDVPLNKTFVCKVCEQKPNVVHIYLPPWTAQVTDNETNVEVTRPAEDLHEPRDFSP